MSGVSAMALALEGGRNFLKKLGFGLVLVFSGLKMGLTEWTPSWGTKRVSFGVSVDQVQIKIFLAQSSYQDVRVYEGVMVCT